MREIGRRWGRLIVNGGNICSQKASMFDTEVEELERHAILYPLNSSAAASEETGRAARDAMKTFASTLSTREDSGFVFSNFRC